MKKLNAKNLKSRRRFLIGIAMKLSLARLPAAALAGSAQPFVPARLMPALLYKLNPMTHSLRSVARAAMA